MKWFMIVIGVVMMIWGALSINKISVDYTDSLIFAGIGINTFSQDVDIFTVFMSPLSIIVGAMFFCTGVLLKQNTD